jgi:hypothetical protein
MRFLTAALSGGLLVGLIGLALLLIAREANLSLTYVAPNLQKLPPAIDPLSIDCSSSCSSQV